MVIPGMPVSAQKIKVSIQKNKVFPPKNKVFKVFRLFAFSTQFSVDSIRRFAR